MLPLSRFKLGCWSVFSMTLFWCPGFSTPFAEETTPLFGCSSWTNVDDVFFAAASAARDLVIIFEMSQLVIWEVVHVRQNSGACYTWKIRKILFEEAGIKKIKRGGRLQVLGRFQYIVNDVRYLSWRTSTSFPGSSLCFEKEDPGNEVGCYCYRATKVAMILTLLLCHTPHKRNLLLLLSGKLIAIIDFSHNFR